MRCEQKMDEAKAYICGALLAAEAGDVNRTLDFLSMATRATLPILLSTLRGVDLMNQPRSAGQHRVLAFERDRKPRRST